jgi:hypothetical protein
VVGPAHPVSTITELTAIMPVTSRCPVVFCWFTLLTVFPCMRGVNIRPRSLPHGLPLRVR